MSSSLQSQEAQMQVVESERTHLGRVFECLFFSCSTITKNLTTTKILQVPLFLSQSANIFMNAN